MTEALTLALRDLFRPRMLGLVLWPLLGAALLWIGIAFFFWDDMVDGLRRLLAWGVQQDWLSESLARVLGEWIVAVLLLVALPPLTVATALLVTSTIAMPIMVRDVAARDFPQLQRRHGGTALGGVLHALLVTLIYLVLWVVTLPLWLFGAPAFVLPLVLNGWLNARLFRYDALAEHASREEFAALIQREHWPMFGIGVISAAVQLVPFVNLFAPVWTGLAFIHYGLRRLEAARDSGIGRA